MTTPTIRPPSRRVDLACQRRVLDKRLEEQLDKWFVMCPDERASREFLRELWSAPLAPADEFRCAAVEHYARRGWVPCHAAAFGDGRVALAPGASGSGKSTLAAMLAREGLEVSDELVFLREDGERIVAASAPLPLAVSAATLALLPFAEAWRLGSRHVSSDDGGEEKTFLLPPRPLAGTREVAAIVLRDRGGGGQPATLVPADGRATATGLLGNTYRFLHAGPEYAAARRRAWHVVTALVDSVPSFVLEGDLLVGSEAVGDVASIVRGTDRVSA